MIYDYGAEVWLERIELPRFTKVGETYEAVVILSSLEPGEGELTLRENDNEIFRQKVTYAAGKNRYAIPIRLREPGYYEYTATIGPPEGVRREDWADGVDRNNIAISYLYLKGEGRVLVVVDPGGRAARLRRPGPCFDGSQAGSWMCGRPLSSPPTPWHCCPTTALFSPMWGPTCLPPTNWRHCTMRVTTRARAF